MKSNSVVLYINTLAHGGAERVIVQLAEYLAQNGWRTILLTSYPTDNDYEVSKQVERINMQPKNVLMSKFRRNYFRIRKLRSLCREVDPQCVISFMMEPNFRNILATLGLKSKSIVAVRNNPSQEYSGLLGQIVGKFLFKFSDKVVFQTLGEKQWFPKVIQDNSIIIPNMVSSRFFDTIHNGGNDIVTVGRLTEQKNQALLIKSFANIESKFANTDLQIFGVGDQYDNLRQLVKNLNLLNRVHFNGVTDEVPKELSKAAVFVLTSDYEGMPNALMEALAVGVPCISTDCPSGPNDLIKDNENGLLVPVGDEKQLSDALVQLLDNPLRANKLGNSAKKSSQVFKEKSVLEQWKMLILGMVEDR